MKKQISLLLVTAMLVGTLLSCAGGENETKQSGGDGAQTDTVETETESETLYAPDDLPAELRYDGVTATIFGWSDPAAIEFYAEELNGELVNDAIHARNLAVEERLGLRLTYVLEPGSNPNQGTWVKSIENSVRAGDQAYDVAAGYSMAGATLAYDHMLLDLADQPYLSFDKPWWPRSLMDEATCGGKLYFCSGDISTYMIYYMYAAYFNKQMVEDHGLADPYALVHEGKWTLDTMLSMAGGIYMDVNGDGKKDDGDRYGMVLHTTYIDPFFFGVGLRTTEKNAEDIPVLAASFGGEKTHWLLTTLNRFFATDDGYMVSGLDGYTIGDNLFKEGRALFTVNEFQYVAIKIRDAEIDYGILPIPKYDEAQQEYSTVMSFPYSLYGIPADAKDPAMSAALMECLASESYRTVTPALFETGMKVKYATDNESAQMFDIIRETIVFDFGRVFTNSMNSMTFSLFRDAVASKKDNWISIYEKNEKKLTAALEKVVNALTSED